MLECAEHFAALLQSLQVCCGHFRHRLGVVAVGTQVQLWVIDLPDIHHRGKIQVNAIGREICRILYAGRSEEHTSELQSLAYLVCRLLLEKKKKIILYQMY